MPFFKPDIQKMLKTKQVWHLIKALQHPDFEIRYQAVEALGELRDNNAVEPLIALLRYDKGQYRDWEIRAAAALSLGKLGDTQAIEPMRRVFQQDVSRVRACAAWALGALGDLQAVEGLIAALADKDELVQEHSATALGLIGGERAVEPLIALLNGEVYQEAYEAAAHALACIRSPNAIDGLLKALKHSNSGIREVALHELENIEGIPVEIFIEVLTDSDSLMRATATGILGKRKAIKAVEPLIIILGDSVSFVAESAARSLGEIGSDKAVEALTSTLQRSNAVRTRIACYYALKHSIKSDIAETDIENLVAMIATELNHLYKLTRPWPTGDYETVTLEDDSGQYELLEEVVSQAPAPDLKQMRHLIAFTPQELRPRVERLVEDGIKALF